MDKKINTGRWRSRSGGPEGRRFVIAYLLTFALFHAGFLSLAATETLAANFTVNSTADTGDFDGGFGTCETASGNGTCTLRAAIESVNTQAGAHTIAFNIAGPGPHTIAPATTYPAIDNLTTIDGTTQPGFAGTPLIVLDGSATAIGNGLFIRSGSGSTVRGLVVNQFSSHGIRVTTSNVTITGNYIGTDATGTLDRGNTLGGILLFTGASGCSIGGTADADRNVISGNGYGILVAAASASSNTILGNRIGTDMSGTLDLGNSSYGIQVYNGASGNTIGGIAAGEANIIVNNGLAGVFVEDTGTGNTVSGNIMVDNGGLGIDLGVAGVTANDSGDGDTGPNDLQNYPVLTAAVSNGVSTSVTGTLNSSSATTYQLEFFQTTAPDPLGYGEGESFMGTTSVTTDGVGDASFALSLPAALTAGASVTATATDPAGNTSEFSASLAATVVDSCPTVTTTADSGPGSLRQCIGYANSNAGTTISFDIPDTDPSYMTSAGNSWWRIAPASQLPTITAAGTIIDGTTQAANYGSDTNPLGPEIEIEGNTGSLAKGFDITSANNTIRGFILGGFNQFGNNGAIHINGAGATGNQISGNYIGTDHTGASANENLAGIYISGGGSNAIGGTTAADRNVISGNSTTGISLVTGSSSNTVSGNYIGADRSGASSVPNGTGISITNLANSNTIGGTTAGARNLISGNSGRGILVSNSDLNDIWGNYIGTDVTGALDLGNANNGVEIANGAQDNAVGGSTAAARNVISGNDQSGIVIRDSGTGQNTVIGNFIGTDTTGTADLGNTQRGIYIIIGADSNTIGGTGGGSGNVIAYNGLAGIELASLGTSPVNNQITGNSIFNNGSLGITLDGAGANNDKVPPVISSVGISGLDFAVTLTTDGGDTVQFFRATNAAAPVVTPDVSGSGEGYLYLGSCTDDGLACSGPHISGTDPTAGDGSISATLTSGGLSAGDIFTATAADPGGNTSGFALNATALGVCTSPGPDVIYYACFDDTVPSTLPSGWTVSPGAGGVVVKVDGATQVLSDGLVGGAPVTSGNPAWTDVSVFQQFRSLTGVVDHAGVIARYVDDSNMVYGGIVSATEAEIWNRVGGVWTQLGPTWTIPDVGTGWHTQEMRLAGDRVDLYVDGVLIGSATLMAGAPAAGRTGFWSQYGALEGYRDDHTVRDGFYLIEGTVFEDADFDGTPAAYDGGVSDLPLESVDVELYSGTDVYLGSAVAASDGSFGFVVQDGSYKVRVRSATIGDADTPPAGGLNPTVPATWPYPLPEMTWGNGSAMPGGQSATADDADTGDDLGLGDTWVAVTVSGSDVTGADLGFAYNLITNSVDDGLADSTRSHQGSLRQFIKNANAIGTASPTTASSSEFYIPNTDAGYTFSGGNSWWRISPASALPVISDSATVIDGTTQAANYGTDTNNLGPEIELTGGMTVTDGLTVTAAGCTVRGLVINMFTLSGIDIATNGGCTIRGNYIGTNFAGTAQAGNNQQGIIIDNCAGNVIGGTAAADRNVISGNRLRGILIEDTSASGNRVIGNYIGVNAAGTAALTNQQIGAYIWDAPGNSIGGTAAGAGNVLSGNSLYGVYTWGANATGNVLQGNTVGLDAAGLAGVPNGSGGIAISNAPGNSIGGTASGVGNTIASNTGDGIVLFGGSSTGIPILGNTIYENTGLGIDLNNDGVTPNNGTTGALPNIGMDYPVFTSAAVAGTSLHVEGYVGTSTLQVAGTHIIEVFKADDDAGNNGEIESGDGLSVGHGEGRWYINRCLSAADGTFACDLTVPGTVTLAVADSITGTATDSADNTSEFGGNFAITPSSCPTVTRTADSVPGSLRDCIAYANSNAGTTIVFDIPDTAPGYTTSGGNSWWRISPTSGLPTITANGTVIDGTTQAANYGSDTNSLGPEIEIDGSGAGAGASGLTVNVPGGSTVIRQLVVDNFDQSGFLLQGGSTTVTGCYIGLEPDGDILAGNNTSTTVYHGGIRIVSAGNTIGGTDAADRNVISGNTLAGIVLNGAGATGNQVLGNYIGLDAGGTLDRGNIFDGEGIEFQLADGNTIGGTAAGAGNVISGNASDGMEIDGSSNNIVQGNYIGTDYTGTVVIPNDRDGIDINSDLATGSTGNLIGGTAAGAGNLIRGNGIAGVELRDDTVVGATTDNSILGNLIYGNGALGIDLEPVGVMLNDAGDGDTGVNGLQNYPVITAVVSGGVSTTITGTLNSYASTTFRLEFYSTSSPDPLGYGEGDSFLGTTSVTTDGSGDASFTVNFPTGLTTGDYVTATATGPTGSTSEFSANAVLPLGLVKQAMLSSDGSLIANASTLPRGTVFKFLIYTENPGAARSDVSVRDVLDSAFAYSTGSLKVDNSAAVGASVQAIYSAVNGVAVLTDTIDADVASITGSTIDVGNQYIANGQLDIAANRIWALLFTVRMQ